MEATKEKIDWSKPLELYGGQGDGTPDPISWVDESDLPGVRRISWLNNRRNGFASDDGTVYTEDLDKCSFRVRNVPEAKPEPYYKSISGVRVLDLMYSKSDGTVGAWLTVDGESSGYVGLYGRHDQWDAATTLPESATHDKLVEISGWPISRVAELAETIRQQRREKAGPKPRWKHDRDEDVYLCGIGTTDYYLADHKDGNRFIVARWGDTDLCFRCSTFFQDIHGDGGEWATAKKVAIARGLIPAEKPKPEPKPWTLETVPALNMLEFREKRRKDRYVAKLADDNGIGFTSNDGALYVPWSTLLSDYEHRYQGGKWGLCGEQP